MPKLYLYRGLPGSGKTTAAREQMAKDGNIVRINFDDLRASFFVGGWSWQKEELVNDAAEQIIRVAAGKGQNVIVDNTNLMTKHVDRYKHLAKLFSMDFVEKRFDLFILDCVANDMKRLGTKAHVGRAVIERLAYSSGWCKFQPHQRIVVFDVDGTLADSSHRAKEFLRIPSGAGQKNEWDKFFAAAVNDNPIEIVQKWAQAVYNSFDQTVVILSGRSDDYATDTVNWLAKHNIRFDNLFMRRRGDKREDFIIKEEIVRQILPLNQIDYVVDDRQQVIDMWRRVKAAENLSYHVFQVAEGNF